MSNEFNSLNQLSGSTWKGLTVIGQANYGAGTVTVNGVTAQLYTNGLFSVTNLSVSAGSDETITAVFHGPAFTNTACVATDEVTVAVGTPACSYDPNGNMTEDSRSWYYYDLADRLIRVVSKETSNTVLECSYDGLGRRREVTRDGTNIERYVYLPGTFLVLAVLDDNDAVKEIYTYGPDLSGTLSGAGGVGGILGGVDFIESVTNAMHSDALGNIVMLTDDDGAVVATYQYGPFGKITGQTGTRSSRFMFSSKEYDPEAGLCNFGFRLYDPLRGQWINRDPIGERGGINLYGFVYNNPISLIDLYGLVWWNPFSWFGDNANKPCEDVGGSRMSESCCCGSEVIDPDKQCCEENRVVNKVKVAIINRSGGQRTGLTGGHIDLVLPSVGLVGFFGDQSNPNDGSGREIGWNIPGNLNVGEEWLKGSTPRPAYTLPPGMAITLGKDANNNPIQAQNPKSTICELMVCPSAAKSMISEAEKINSDPGRFRIAGRNCSTMGCQILGAGGIMSGGISGVDNPQHLIDQLQAKGASCRSGYVYWNWQKNASGQLTFDPLEIRVLWSETNP